MDAVISESTRESYERSTATFISWLAQQPEPTNELIPEEFRRAVPELTDRLRIRTALRRHDTSIPPIKFDQLTIQIYMQFILSLRRSDNQAPPGWSTFNLHVSALKNLFRDYNKIMAPEFSTQLRIAFQGLKNTTARATQSSERIQIGKSPLSYSLFRYLGAQSLCYTDKSFIFFHLFLVLCWNLICRAQNVVTVRLGHIEWQEDSLCFFFAHAKNDQGAEKPRDPRHVFANPLMPEICPILALALYFLINPFPTVPSLNEKLFSGSRQYDRFRKVFKELLQKEVVQDEMERRGIDANLLGSHSVRKGAGTYVTSGSTSCPSYAAVCLRAGWKMKGVQDTYLRYDSAGDQYVGRTVAGLPITDPDFALLPPFIPRTDEQIQAAVQTAFPNFPLALHGLQPFLLSALIYHRQFLRRELPSDHPVLRHRLFHEPETLDRLGSTVVCRRHQDGDPLSPTGVPPHVAILSEIRDLGREIPRLATSISALAPEVAARIEYVLEERAIAARSVTPVELSSILDRELTAIRQLLSGALSPSSTSTSNSSETHETHTGTTISLWGGRLHLLPETFELPTGNCFDAWAWWCLGSANHQVPPLRRLTPHEFSSKLRKKQFGHFQYLNNTIEARLREIGVTPNWERLDDGAAAQLFHQSGVLSCIPSQTSQNRKRRTNEISWQTCVSILRNGKRQRGHDQ